jgi:hypothetical protein
MVISAGNRPLVDEQFLRELPKAWPAVNEVWVIVGVSPRSVWKCRAARNGSLKAEAVPAPPSADHPGGVRIALLPARTTLLRRVDVPFASARKSRELLPFLLDAEIPFPIETACYAFERPSDKLAALEGLATTAWMGVAALKDDVIRYHTELEKADAQADVLDAEALAMWEMLAGPDVSHPRRILLWVEASRVVAMRGIAFPEDTAVWSRDATHTRLDALQSRWWRWLQSMPAERRAGVQVHVFSEEVTTQQDVEALGGEALLPDATWLFEPHPHRALAEAAAQRFQRRRTLNLSVPEHVPPRVHQWMDRRRRRMGWSLAFWAGLPLCLALATSVGAWWKNRLIEREIARIAQTITGGQAVQTSMAPLLATRAMDDLAERAQRMDRHLGHTTAGLWTTIQQTALSNGLVLHSIDLTASRLVIRGLAGARSAGEALEQTLAASGWSARLEWSGTEQAGLSFTLTGEGAP